MRIIQARAKTLCIVCQRDINPGSQTAHRAGYGWVHYPACMTCAPKSPVAAALPKSPATPAAATPKSEWDEFDEPEADEPEPFDPEPLDVPEAAVRKSMGLPAQKSEPSIGTQADAIEAKVFAELKRSLADQTRLVRGMVKGEMKSAFDEVLPELLSRLTVQVKAATTELVAQKLDDARKEFKTETARAIARIANSGLVRQEISLVRPTGEKVELKGEVFHPKFDRVLRLASAGKPIFCPGPTGCGKTHMASQVARALFGEKWQEKFGILSCSPATAERHFLGRSIPNISNGSEVYRAAEFVNIYENGGVFCADEIDAADASVLLVFNAALANGYLPVPDRIERPIARRHPDFVFIACANTWGRGADRRYVGRNPLDEATLDRFRIGTVPLNYSPLIERVKCPDTDLFEVLAGWRKKIFEERLERVLSTRFFGDAFDMLQAGDSMDDIAQSFFSGWRTEEVRKVYGRELPSEE